MRAWIRQLIAFVLLLAASLPFAGRAHAWGDEGHEIVALIAQNFLAPMAKRKLTLLLQADHDTLTAPDIASRATWADRFRDSDRHTTKQHYNATHEWHFVDMELAGPDMNAACFGRPPLSGPASLGPAEACVVDKILQFSAEFAQLHGTDPERLLALKFLLHFVGDVHQPLHSADNHDRGGNDVMVIFGNRAAPIPLHSYWDTIVVQRLGRNPGAAAAQLIARFGNRRAEWMRGTAEDWARESFAIAKSVAYNLPASGGPGEHDQASGSQKPVFHLDAAYEVKANAAAAEQLAKGGMRLAMLLNAALK